MNNWLKSLKAGDIVIVSSHFGESICKVEKITPTGKIRVGGNLFTDGLHRQVWGYDRLEEATDERIAKIRKKAKIRKVLNLMRETKDITYEEAVAIEKILTGTDEQ